MHIFECVVACLGVCVDIYLGVCVCVCVDAASNGSLAANVQ